MKATGLSLVLFIVVIGIMQAAPAEFGDIQVTRWIDPYGRTPMSYEEYLTNHPPTPLRAQRLITPQAPSDLTPMVVLVESTLYPDISSSINTYMNDLTADDFDVMLVQWGGGTPEQLKDSLVAWWNNDLADGAVLIGDLPIPWFELYEDFNDDSIPDNPVMVDFPCDLFYMDMDGTWEDQDQDGIYDIHEGDTGAEICIGQLRALPLSSSEAERINNYFAKNHAYRQGNLILPSIALNYIDDDWEGSAYSWGNSLRTAFGAINTINDINETTAIEYLSQLTEGYSMIQVAVHSSPFVHAFKEINGTIWGYIQNWEIRDSDPDAYFYNLFACSNCRYVENDYMGGWYVFGDSYGLGAVGSTKTGAMLYFEDYYSVLADMGTFGEALANWISIHGNIPGHQMWSRSWFYGMTHLGDPTLRVPLNLRFADAEIDDDSLGVSRGDNDGIFDAGEKIELTIEVENPMSTACQNVSLVISATDTFLSFYNDSIAVPNIPAEGSAIFEGFALESSLTTPNGHESLINMTMTDNTGHTWYDSFVLEIFAPVPECIAYQITEVTGNGNGWVDPGETVELDLQIRNTGGETARGLSASVQLVSGNVTMISTQLEYGDLDPDEIAYAQSPISFTVDSTHPQREAVQFGIAFNIDELQIGERFIAVPMSIGYDAVFTFEIEEPSLRHYSITDNYQDAWHRSTQFAYNGSGSEKFGDIGEGEYPPMADGALEFPLFPIGGTAALNIWHRMDAEIGYDGGIVEINTGEGWSLLNPIGGYPHTAGNNGSFPAYTPCFSGENDWTQVAFDLPTAAGFAKIRFRFGSDGGVEGLGWFLDDVTLSSAQVSVDEGYHKIAVPIDFTLQPVYPNPFNGTTKIEFSIPPGLHQEAELAVFNILGQRVTTLWQGTEQGRHSLVWSGTNANNKPLGSGLYFVRLESSENFMIRKLIILR